MKACDDAGRWCVLKRKAGGVVLPFMSASKDVHRSWPSGHQGGWGWGVPRGQKEVCAFPIDWLCLKFHFPQKPLFFRFRRCGAGGLAG